MYTLEFVTQITGITIKKRARKRGVPYFGKLSFRKEKNRRTAWKNVPYFGKLLFRREKKVANSTPHFILLKIITHFLFLKNLNWNDYIPDSSFLFLPLPISYFPLKLQLFLRRRWLSANLPKKVNIMENNYWEENSCFKLGLYNMKWQKKLSVFFIFSNNA